MYSTMVMSLTLNVELFCPLSLHLLLVPRGSRVVLALYDTLVGGVCFAVSPCSSQHLTFQESLMHTVNHKQIINLKNVLQSFCYMPLWYIYLKCDCNYNTLLMAMQPKNLKLQRFKPSHLSE